jgi:hypothetical protein
MKYKLLSVFHFYSFIYFYYFYYGCTGDTLWHLQKFLKYIIVKLTPPHHSPLCPLPHYWNSFNRPHFSIYSYVFVVFPPHSPSHTLCWYPPPPVSNNFPDCFAFLFFFCTKNKKTFLFKIATQGVSLWQFHVYMYYNLNWFFLSIFLLSTLVPFLWWFQQV